MDRDTLLRLIGPLPEKVPLDSKTIESEDCGSYRREKVEYSVEPGERISAYLLIPNGGPSARPAIFCHHQHAGNYRLGKREVVGLAGDPDQAYARELAERGFVTFAPDAICFEERNRGDYSWQAAWFELVSRLSSGQTLLAKVLHDVSVGIDYLCSRADVDSARIGFIGHSYGGRMAHFAPVFDRRIKASVSSCGCASYSEMLKPDAGVQFEFCVPGLLQHGDLADIAKLIEPASLLILAAESDKWSRGAADLYSQIKPAFKQGKVDLEIYPGPHAFTTQMREEAYNFFAKHL